MTLLKKFDVSGKRVLYFADLNIPQNEQGQVVDDHKLKLLCPTLLYLTNNGAEIWIIGHSIFHGVRPSLARVAARLSELLKKEVTFQSDLFFVNLSPEISRINPGQIMLIENLLRHPEYDSNNRTYLRTLGQACNIFVNDNLTEANLKLPAVTSLPAIFAEKTAGLLLQKESDFLKRTLSQPKRPLCLVIGGSRLATKFEILTRFAPCADKIVVGGALANTFLAAQGLQMGRSLQEPEYFQKTLALLVQLARRECKVYLPVDFLVGPSSTVRGLARAVPVQEVPADTQALDIGPATNLLFREALQNAETIFWNGAMGVYENDDYENGTCEMVNSLASSHATTIVAGTDTAAAIRKMELEHKFSHISSAGDVFLELIKGAHPTSLQALGLL